MSGFEDQDLYQAARRLIRFLDGIADRFPDEEREAIHRPMRDRSLEIGARIAAGFSCLGEGGARFPEGARRDIRARLAECRHYMLTAGDAHHVDEEAFAEFERIHGDLARALDHLAGPEGA